MKLVLVTAPAVEAVTVDDLKSHLRIDGTDEDTVLAAIVAAARIHVEQTILRRALITQTFDLYFDDFSTSGLIRLPRPPLVSVTGVYYTPEGGVETTFSGANYVVDNKTTPGAVVLKRNCSWPADVLEPVNGVRVRFVAGYGANGTSVPAPILQAIKLLGGDLYENREGSVVGQGVSVVSVPIGVTYLCQAFRTWEY